jgi:outer membrane protein OmpA-like peptidoglycan-associated protein
MRKFLVAVPILMLAVGSTACATKKFVRTSVGEVNDKVEATNRSLEETQERTRRNEGRINEVDQKVDQKAAELAQATQTAQSSANNAASVAKVADTKADTVSAKADAIDKASKRLVFEVVLSEDQGNFKFAKTVLPDEAKAKLDEMITALKADPKGAYFEIEGHTDNVGDAKTNDRIGLERAESVKRYLYEQHQIPLHKMNVVSYGKEKPVAPNKTKAGRAQNRRVVIRVLA